jgi:DNA-binding MarR family transcriptional regulator
MSDRMDFELRNFFPYLVRMYYKAVSHRVRDIYQSLYGLSVDEWRTMANLYDYEPMTAKEIVNRSSINKVNVSRAIASLQNRNLIERHEDPTDRRRVLVCLTAQGKRILNDLIPLVKEAEQDMLSALTPDEQDTLIRLMDKVKKQAAAGQTPLNS